MKPPYSYAPFPSNPGIRVYPKSPKVLFENSKLKLVQQDSAIYIPDGQDSPYYYKGKTGNLDIHVRRLYKKLWLLGWWSIKQHQITYNADYPPYIMSCCMGGDTQSMNEKTFTENGLGVAQFEAIKPIEYIL